MSTLVLAPLLVALGTGILTLVTQFDGRLQRAVSLLGGVGYLGVVSLLFDRVVLGAGGPAVLSAYASDWPAPLGITFVADSLAVFMLALAAIVSLAALVFATVYIDEFAQRLSFAPLFHFMLGGVTGSFLTADVFNLFVWFEVMLMASYVLVLFYSGPEHTRAAFIYVVLNLIGSAIMLLAIGGLYATVGTLNMADMARRLANPAAYGVEVAPTLGLAALLLAVFALKAGVVPFHFWVPSAYRAAPAPVAAMLAGVVKKVGVYAIIRLFFTVFAGATYANTGTFTYVAPVLFVTAVASILYGGVGAVGREEIDGLLAFSSIGQIGFIVLPLALAMAAPDLAVSFGAADGTLATLGIAAALVYTFNHGLAKALLFLASGAVHSAVGTNRFDQLGGLASNTPLLAASFLLGGLSLIGVPPLIGFFGKLLVFRTAVVGIANGVPGAAIALAVVLVGAVLTIAYVTRAWNEVFWGSPSEEVRTTLPTRLGRLGDADSPATDGGDTSRDDVAFTLQLTVVVGLAACLIGFGVGVEFVIDVATYAAHAATDTAGYIDAVAPRDVGASGGEH